MASVRFGIISTADIGVAKVIPAMQQADGVEITAIASRTGDRAAEAADALGLPKAYDSYEALLDDGDIDAVYIPLPNDLHAEWTFRAAEAGKHVLCEKPLAMSSAQAREMVDACAAAGVKLQEAFMYRHHPTWVEAIIQPKGYSPVEAGTLGALMLVGGLFGAVILPMISDKIGRRKIFVQLGVIFAIPGLLGMAYFDSLLMLNISAFWIGFFLISVGPTGMQYVAEITHPTPEGTSNGLIQLFGQASVVYVYVMEALRTACRVLASSVRPRLRNPSTVLPCRFLRSALSQSNRSRRAASDPAERNARGPRGRGWQAASSTLASLRQRRQLIYSARSPERDPGLRCATVVGRSHPSVFGPEA